MYILCCQLHFICTIHICLNIHTFLGSGTGCKSLMSRLGLHSAREWSLQYSTKAGTDGKLRGCTKPYCPQSPNTLSSLFVAPFLQEQSTGSFSNIYCIQKRSSRNHVQRRKCTSLEFHSRAVSACIPLYRSTSVYCPFLVAASRTKKEPSGMSRRASSTSDLGNDMCIQVYVRRCQLQ